jgi:hypothetical protein
MTWVVLHVLLAFLLEFASLDYVTVACLWLLSLFSYHYCHRLGPSTRQEWRQNSWGGWAVRQSMAVAAHIKPFFDAVMDASDRYTREESPVLRIFWYLGPRAVIILSGILFVLTGGKVLQLLVGRDDVTLVQEVVIVHEYDTEEEAAAARAAQASGEGQEAAAVRASQGRGKRQKQKAV